MPLPKLTSDLNRVVVFKMITNDVEKFDPQALIAHALNVCIVRLLEDKAISNVLVCDLTGCHMGHLARLSPLFIKKVLYLVESVYTTRMEGMHYINCPPYVDKFLTLLKSIMKPKVAERVRTKFAAWTINNYRQICVQVYVHKDLDSLYKEVPKAVLPKDLGGDEKSLAELNGEFVWFGKIWNLFSMIFLQIFWKINSMNTDNISIIWSSWKWTKHYVPGNHSTMSCLVILVISKNLRLTRWWWLRNRTNTFAFFI